jgi:hypothetical protein
VPIDDDTIARISGARYQPKFDASNLVQVRMMTKIPDDIIMAAGEVLDNLPLGHEEESVRVIARALLAERERSAGLADDYAIRCWAALQPAEEAAVAAEKIAAAIRSG